MPLIVMNTKNRAKLTQKPLFPFSPKNYEILGTYNVMWFRTAKAIEYHMPKTVVIIYSKMRQCKLN